MAVTAKVYATHALEINTSYPVNWLNDTIKVALLTSSYTPTQTTDRTFSDVSTYEVAGTGYTSGGMTLGTKTATKSGGVIALDAADASWTSSTITARYAAVYAQTGVGNLLVGYVNFGADQSSVAGTFTITWNASGIITYTV